MSKEEKKQPSINEALFKVKKELGALKKEAKNPFFRSNYADLNSHLQLIEPLLQKHGLVLTQPVMTNGQVNMVSTDVTLKATGDVVKSQLSLPQTEDMQKLGSAITYARRYTLGSLFGMQALDDDANLASGKISKKGSKGTSDASIF